MKKWFQKIELGLFGFIILALVFIYLRSAFVGKVDDSGLKLERANIPAGANAYDVLQTATNHFWWPDNQRQRLSELAQDTNWDGNLAATVLATNREALAGWDAAAKLPDLQVPGISTINDSRFYLQDWRKFAMLAQIRENVLLHNGQEQEAFDQIVNQIQIGRRMENSRGDLIEYLVGDAVESLGLNQIQHWAGKVHLSSGQLKDCIRQIEPAPGAEAAAFANAMKVEYQVNISTLDAMRQGKLTNSVGEDPPIHGWVWPIFDFRQTQSLFAKGTLTLVEAAPHYYKDIDLSQLESQRGTTLIFLSGNPIGEMYYDMLMPSLGGKSVEKKCEMDVQLRATQTILGLRAYQLTQGKLPENLDALAPEFLDKAPMDAFNGEPLHYSAEKKIVYSVGKNLKDDGGDDRSNAAPNQNHLDLVYKFDF